MQAVKVIRRLVVEVADPPAEIERPVVIHLETLGQTKGAVPGPSGFYFLVDGQRGLRGTSRARAAKIPGSWTGCFRRTVCVVVDHPRYNPASTA